MTGRELLDQLGQVLADVRRLRYRDLATFDDVATVDLERAARGLRRAAVDLQQGADLLDRAIAARTDVAS